MARPSLPKEIEAAIAYAESKAWIVAKSSRHAHASGRMKCPCHTREGCQVSIWSTPRDAGNHARQLRRAIDRCNCQPT